MLSKEIMPRWSSETQFMHTLLNWQQTMEGKTIFGWIFSFCSCFQEHSVSRRSLIRLRISKLNIQFQLSVHRKLGQNFNEMGDLEKTLRDYMRWICKIKLRERKRKLLDRSIFYKGVQLGYVKKINIRVKLRYLYNPDEHLVFQFKTKDHVVTLSETKGVTIFQWQK